MNFVLDSGSSAHMISNSNLFFSIKHKEEGIVRTSSGAEALKIMGTGSIKLSNQYGDIFLHNVLYVPDISVNLLSVRCLVLEGYQVCFEMNSFNIKKNNSVCMSGRYINNLPTLMFSNLTHDALLNSAELLHKALGHVTRGSFHTRHSKASKPFEEIHLDVVGPITPSSREGDRYFLTVVDSCTRYCSALPLKNKSDVGSVLTQALDLEAKRLGYYPSVIHSDRGTEFINAYLLEFCNKNRIRTRYSDAYTPQQNGLAERFNRTIIESARAILKDSNLSLHYWNEIIKASALTLNQIPSHRSKKSPFELFKNRTLPLNYFKPIGIRVSYLYLPDNSNSKLAQIGGLGHVVGYNEELRSYRVATESGKVINSKHLTFLNFPTSKADDSNLNIGDDFLEIADNSNEKKDSSEAKIGPLKSNP
ncbi:hypothetical protein VP01_127g1 [Puccinia sorghi]|uniref:Integrase catalytic domain-containing protein n=1 Tax=Puccinia sorghi TaxID=27349 RepID=A0A0L6VNT1_9BASI|nr:hypothetical protein VP01_127g1 [Puccinia sorghi]